MADGDAERLRVICLSDVFPWPARDGYRLRLSHALRALSQVTDVDLIAAETRDSDLSAVPADIPLARVAVTRAPLLRPDARLGLRTLRSPLPRRVLWRDWTASRRDLAGFGTGTYDVAWYSHTDARAGFGPVSARRVVHDAVDFEAARLRSLRRAHLGGLRLALSDRGPDLRPEVRRRLAGVAATLDAGRWARLQRQVAAGADLTLISSEIDRDRLAADRVAVVANGYEAPATPVSSPPDGHLLSMVGLFHYGPNSDGARFFVNDVLPLIHRQLPDAAVRLIGRHDGHLADIADRDSVQLTGEVDEIPPALTGTRAVIVPLRAGAGTRLKILEAFACRIPVITTSVGCEGIGGVDGREYLVADDAAGFARACVRVLTDDRLHRTLTDHGWALFAQRYRWADIEARIQRLIADLASGSAPA